MSWTAPFRLTDSAGKPRFDLSALTLILSNLFTIGIAVLENWSLLTVMWVYWFQSVTIGLFNFVRILMRSFRQMNAPGAGGLLGVGGVFAAIFFAWHYGGFHLAYAFFMLFFTAVSYTLPDAYRPHIAAIIIASTVFFLNHLFSFIYNSKNDKQEGIVGLMMRPYARIIPMHLTIVFGMFMGLMSSQDSNLPVLLLFLTLKMIADVIMHLQEHR